MLLSYCESTMPAVDTFLRDALAERNPRAKTVGQAPSARAVARVGLFSIISCSLRGITDDLQSVRET